jgi:hypothetical protein
LKPKWAHQATSILWHNKSSKIIVLSSDKSPLRERERRIMHSKKKKRWKNPIFKKERRRKMSEGRRQEARSHVVWV